jgi:hypothetical protein
MDAVWSKDGFHEQPLAAEPELLASPPGFEHPKENEAEPEPEEPKDEPKPEGKVEEPKGSGKGKGEDIMEDIAAAVQNSNVLKMEDFDGRVKRFLSIVRSSGGKSKVKDALAMVHTYTNQKSREAVRNWPAYVLTLLKKFDPEAAAKAERPNTRNDTNHNPPSKTPPATAKMRTTPDKVREAAAAAVAAQTQPLLKTRIAAAVGAGCKRSATPTAFLDLKDAAWTSGREQALSAVGDALGMMSGGSQVDHRVALGTELGAALAGFGQAQSRTACHVIALARCRSLQESSRSARAAKAADVPAELRNLSEDSSLATAGAKAAMLASKGNKLAEAVLQEMGIELAVQLVENPCVQPYM